MTSHLLPGQAGLLSASAPSASGNPPYTVVLDEMSYYFGNNDDALKEKLRSTPGIPNATYVVQADGVFVFDKLVALVKEDLGSQGYRADAPNDKAAEFALQRLAQAIVTPAEAVSQWNVVPAAFNLRHQHGRGYHIEHQYFNASVQGPLKDKSAVNEVLTLLLTGRPHQGICDPGRQGSFTYRGQSMQALASFDPSDLPERPSVSDCGVRASVSPYSTPLSEATYFSGFDLVTQADFEVIRGLEISWSQLRANALEHAKEGIEQLWECTDDFLLDLLNDPADSFDEHEAESAQKLRDQYPELGMMAKATIWALFDGYQYECRGMRSWDFDGNRQNDFLPYLLGKRLSAELSGGDAKEAGLWACSELLKGKTLDEAFTLGKKAIEYSRALLILSMRVRTAMLFLEEDQGHDPAVGPRVYTMLDTMRVGHKMLAKPIQSQQSLENFMVSPQSADEATEALGESSKAHRLGTSPKR